MLGFRNVATSTQQAQPPLYSSGIPTLELGLFWGIRWDVQIAVLCDISSFLQQWISVNSMELSACLNSSGTPAFAPSE